MNDVSPETRGQRKVKTSLALALFEAMRDHDFPSEVFEDENLSVTFRGASDSPAWLASRSSATAR